MYMKLGNIIQKYSFMQFYLEPARTMLVLYQILASTVYGNLCCCLIQSGKSKVA